MNGRRGQHVRGTAGRARQGSSPAKLGDVLGNLMARRGYAQVQSCEQRSQAWQEAAGSLLASHSRAGNVRRGVLEVTVRNSSVLQELTFQKRQLLDELARLLPDQPISDLRFRVGSVD